MKRIDKIYEYIKERSKGYSRSDMKGRIGVDAAEISEKLNILRNNVSMELNSLHRQDKIVKIMGRPVLYFDKAFLEENCGAVLTSGPCQVQTLDECIAKPSIQGPFDRLIGSNGSLRKQVEQAKAAILYPPDGLHTLIVGQTGVGKTLFAHMMYVYGKEMGKFATEAPFVTFNCADYYNNSQLLISHIFGHIKGAFTGADTAKAGLVEAADKGILFLDEIHRLPPEGQEMIFYFIDTGTFNRLGETTRNRSAKVLIIGATTEDPNSVLTKTFVRRIPNIITIQPLAERSMEEKLAIIKLLFADEVHRINKPVKISIEAVKALLGSISNGNVGQLKSNIKLLCAKAFLNDIDKPDFIEIDFKMLPAKIKDGLLTVSANRKDLAKLAEHMSEALFITPSGEKLPITDESDRDAFNLYQVVEDKVSLLKGEGIRGELIKQIVATDVNVYIKSFYNKQDISMSTRERLLKILDPSIVDFTEKINLLVQKRLNHVYQDRFLYAFSLHFSAFLKRIKSNEGLHGDNLSGAMPADSLEFQVAIEIKDKIEAHYEVEVPPEEIEYFALLLSSLRAEEHDEKVVILVATHGRSAAMSMVEVAQKLFSSNDMDIIAVDMPLEVNPEESLEKMICKLQEINYQKGVLLLVDMGSLCNFGALIMERLDVEVKTLDMVSMPLILEAMRKADIVGMDLKSIYDSLIDFKGYEVRALHDEDELPDSDDIIVTICTSGEGAARKLKEMVESILKHMVKRRIKVIPIGVHRLEEKLAELAEEKNILAAVGMVKPKFSLPFISLDKLISGEGEEILSSILKVEARSKRNDKNVVVKNLCRESLEKFLLYLNPHKILSVLLEFTSVLEKGLEKQFNNPVKIRLLVHCGCALERMVVNEGLVYQGDREEIDAQKLKVLREASGVFEKTLKLRLTDDELLYILDMI